MAPRLEFLGYFVVLLFGVGAHLVEPRLSWPAFLAVVAMHLVALRYLCRHMAKRFKFDQPGKKAA